MRLALIIIVSYLLGSIPFGYLIVSAKTGSDIRQTGSGGTGATNVSRRAGKSAGVITLILDMTKGAAAVFFAKVILSGVEKPHAAWWIGMAGIVAMLGHIFPVWLGFRGGKGVATAVGVLVTLTPLPMLFAWPIFIIVFRLTRYVSLGSLVMAAAVPVLVLIESLIFPRKETLAMFIAALTGSALIAYAHRENIRRLMSGTENKI